MHGIREHAAPSDLGALKATPLALFVWSRMETGIKYIDGQGSMQHMLRPKGSVRGAYHLCLLETDWLVSVCFGGVEAAVSCHQAAVVYSRFASQGECFSYHPPYPSGHRQRPL